MLFHNDNTGCDIFLNVKVRFEGKVFSKYFTLKEYVYKTTFRVLGLLFCYYPVFCNDALLWVFKYLIKVTMLSVLAFTFSF